ncbi:MAG: outer membrane protein [Gammaproteobacteria bacterium]
MNIRIIKLLSVLILAFGFAGMSFAVAPGPYLGLQFGMSQTQIKKSPDSSSSVNNNAPGGGLVIGSEMSKYFAAEFFITHFANATNNYPVINCGSRVIHTNATGFAGRGILALGNSGLDGFIKAGAAVVRSSGGGVCPSSQTSTSIRPVIGLGVSYAFTQNLVGDFSYTKLILNTTVNSSALVAIGISYHFVDTYCGQFLC